MSTFNDGVFQYSIFGTQVRVSGLVIPDLTIYSIPSRVTHPGTGVEYLVTGISGNLFMNKNLITEIILPNTITSIDSNVFSGCIGLTIAPQLSNVNTLGINLFSGCTGLQSVIIPVGITSIPNGTFTGCTGLKNITIPPNIQSIGTGVFQNCTELISILLENNICNITSIGSNAFASCTKLSSIEIQKIVNNITNVGSAAFNGCINLTSLSLPKVTSIGNNAFQNCSELHSIDIPKVETIGNFAFYTCWKLNSIIIPNTIKSIGTNCYTFTNSSITFLGSSNNIIDMTVFNTTFYGEYNFIFSNVLSKDDILTSSIYILYTSKVINATYMLVDLGCFLTDSKVLTDSQHVPIQDLKKGDLVKTLNHGLLPVKFVGKRSIYNYPTKERIISHLYKLNKKDFIELSEDLFITGGHPLLVDNVNEETKKKLLDLSEMGTPIITEGKFRVFACVHPKAELWNDEGMKDIYDIVLENEDPHQNYGIWVNGVLTESMDEDFFLNYSKMTEINN